MSKNSVDESVATLGRALRRRSFYDVPLAKTRAAKMTPECQGPVSSKLRRDADADGVRLAACGEGCLNGR